MPQYLIVKPCIYASPDGTTSVQYGQEAADARLTVVELPAELAASLGDAVVPLEAPAPEPPPTRHRERVKMEAEPDGG